MITRIQFKKQTECRISDTWLAPYSEESFYVIDGRYIIISDSIYDFDSDHYENLFTVLETWE